MHKRYPSVFSYNSVPAGCGLGKRGKTEGIRVHIVYLHFPVMWMLRKLISCVKSSMICWQLTYDYRDYEKHKMCFDTCEM